MPEQTGRLVTKLKATSPCSQGRGKTPFRQSLKPIPRDSRTANASLLVPVTTDGESDPDFPLCPPVNFELGERTGKALNHPWLNKSQSFP